MNVVPSGFFVLRTPLLPFDDLIAWGRDLSAPVSIESPEHLEQAGLSDRALLGARLRAIVGRPEVLEALFVGSPDLVESVEVWRRDPGSDRGQRIERALVRYVTRMAGRPMPFGLFSGCSTGSIGGETRLELDPRSSYRSHSRLDMNYLSALIDALVRDPDLRDALLFRPNSSLYQAGGRLRYTESRLKGGSRSHHLVVVEKTSYLEVTLQRSKDGARVGELAGALAATEEDVSMEEASEYVNDLIESQILVPDLQAAVTGREPIHGLLKALGGLPAAAGVTGALERVQRLLASLDEEGPGREIARYRKAAAELEDLPAKVTPSRLFQVDMIKPAPLATLGNEAIAEIVRGVEILHRIAGQSVDAQFARFREAFTARYEGQEVPLLEALDEEVGVGFMRSAAPGAEGSPLLEGLSIPPGVAEPGRWTARDAYLLGKVEEAIRSGAQEIDLEDADLRSLETAERPPLPDAFAVSASLCAVSHEAFAQGQFQVLLALAAGPSGARLLGRFCHSDQRLKELVEGHLRSEEACDPEAIFAEIVHLPEGRLGNVLCRPVLREYEIPFLGVSGAPVDRQIPVSDLTLRVEGGRVVLRSRRLGRRVIPRLSNAHNYMRRSVGVYRFLSLLQDQGVSCSIFWSWGLLESLSFLPRVRTGRVILSPRRWRLDRHDLTALGTHHGADLYRTVQKVRSARGLPRWIELADGGDELPIDLDNILSVEMFVELVKRRGGVLLREMLPSPEELCARGPEGRFVHEIVVPFVRPPEPLLHDRASTPAVTSSVTRSFPPGSEWSYVKLYTGTASADTLLKEVVAPMMREALGSGDADRWFFIRYADPDWHLRLRLRGDPGALPRKVLPLLHAALEPLIKEGLVWRVQLDTYEREVERYGGADAIVLVERIFHEDSEAVLAILDQLEGDEGADLRWRLALVGIDMLLSDFGFDPGARRMIVSRGREGLFKELRGGKGLAIRMGGKFRTERKDLERLCDPESAARGPLAPALEPLRERSRRLRPLVAALGVLHDGGGLSVPLADLAASCVHLHVNRLLRSAHRAQEMVLYDFLERIYASRAARAARSALLERDPARKP